MGYGRPATITPASPAAAASLTAQVLPPRTERMGLDRSCNSVEQAGRTPGGEPPFQPFAARRSRSPRHVAIRQRASQGSSDPRDGTPAEPHDRVFGLDRESLELLDELRGGWPLAVASNAPRTHLLAGLTRVDLLKAFDVILGVEEVKAPKPTPDLYLRACELPRTDTLDRARGFPAWRGCRARGRPLRPRCPVSSRHRARGGSRR